jgi:hypothetical protein
VSSVRRSLNKKKISKKAETSNKMKKRLDLSDILKSRGGQEDGKQEDFDAEDEDEDEDMDENESDAAKGLNAAKGSLAGFCIEW